MSTHPHVATSRAWRVVDIVVLAVLAVACGLIFFGWNTIGYVWFQALDAATPGLGGLVAGIWLMAGPLAGAIIRKPGAAVACETLAAVVSMALGSQWGWSTVWSGLAQGLGAELIFLAMAYKGWGWLQVSLAGVGAAAGAWLLEFGLGNWAKTAVFNGTYLVCLLISGFLLAGLLSWALTRALAATGALNRFASGREQAELV